MAISQNSEQYRKAELPSNWGYVYEGEAKQDQTPSGGSQERMEGDNPDGDFQYALQGSFVGVVLDTPMTEEELTLHELHAWERFPIILSQSPFSLVAEEHIEEIKAQERLTSIQEDELFLQRLMDAGLSKEEASYYISITA